MSHTFHRYKIGDEPVAGYRLTDHLGAGGFGEVWKANAPGGTEVALKIIDLTGQQGVQEFAALRVVKKVRHPNLMSLQAFWMKDEEGKLIEDGSDSAPVGTQATSFTPDPKRQTQSSGIAMTASFARPVELIIAMQLGSMSLHKRLEDCRAQNMAGVPLVELLEYMEQSARGIDFLNKPIHDLGKGPVPIVHGDIKPHNILVIGDAAVVCDFGLARAVETLRKTSMAPVTVAYAAPESFKGKVTPTSDQYSLAITYVELRTGRLPFDETMTPYQVMEAHVLRNLDFSRLPEPERLAVERATHTNPDERWPSSRDLVLALRHAAAQTGELQLRPGEAAAYASGPTGVHQLTARPRTPDTDLPTRVPVDSHKETMHPGGHTPSQGFSLMTDPAPLEQVRRSDPLAETSLLGAGLAGAPAAKKSKAAWMWGIAALAAVVAAGAIAIPKMINNSVANALGSRTENSAKKAADGAAPAHEDSTEDTIATAANDPNAQYIKAVQGKIKESDFDGALALLLDKAPKELPGFEKESLQKRLHEAYLSFIDAKIQSEAYARALDSLEDAKSGVGISEAEKQQLREKIRLAWLAQANDELQNDQAARALEIASSILKRYENDREAQIIIARAYLRQRDNEKALAALNKLGATADLPVEYQPLEAGLLLLADGSSASTAESWSKLVDRFLAFTALEKATPPPANLAPSSNEREQLSLLRDRITENVNALLKAKAFPADQAQALVAKLEQLGSSAELEMYKVNSALEAKQYAEARKLLAGVVKSIPAEAVDLKAEAGAMALLIELRDPATKPDEVTKTVSDARKMLGGLTPAMRNDLGAAAEAAALGPAPAALDAAIELAGRTRDLDPGDAADKRVARLLAARLARKAAQTTPPSKEELAKLVQDCEAVGQAGLAIGTVAAFHAECLLLGDSRDRQLLSTLLEHAQPADAYTQFVQARVDSAMAQPNWTLIGDLLTTAYGGDPAHRLPAIDAPFRRAAAATLLTEAAMKKRVAPARGDAAAVSANPFGEAKAAAQAYQWLQLAVSLSHDTDLAANGPKQREMTTNLALAAAWKTEPDEKLAATLSATLSKSSVAELGSDALPALLVVFRTQQAPTADPPAAVRAAQRLIEIFQKQFPVADPQAELLYKDVLQGAVALADGLAAAKTPPADLDTFYASAAEFIKHYQRAKWPFVDKQKEMETLLSKAIKLNGKVAKYYTSRGVARVSQTPPNVEGALADAAEAQKIDTNFPAAYALEGHALIYRSRQQPSSEGRAADLEKAVAKCQTAVEKSKADDKDRSMQLLQLSMAQLEKGNIESDPSARKDLLHQAKANADQAVELEKDRAYPDYAYAAQGNALEDLAWLVGENPEENYAAAMAAFSNAIASNPSSADPLIGRARCYYKALAESKLDPKFLQRTAEEAYQAAIDDLKQAQQLNSAAVEPNLWMGKIYQQLGKFADADDALGAAVKLAEEQHRPERSVYLTEWAHNAVLNRDLSDEQRDQLVHQRTDQLKAAPSLGGASSEKQAALLWGQDLLAQKPPKIAEALKTYDAALADYDKTDPAKQPVDPKKADGADLSLLSARAFCRLLPTSDWNLTAADGVLKDVARIIQLKPGPRFEALADWYSANAKQRSLLSKSPTFTDAKKEDYNKSLLADVQKAIELSPDNPESWQWRVFGAKLIAAKLSLASASPETVKSLGPVARKWIDEAIDAAAKRSDLAAQMDALQRIQQQIETVLTSKGLPRT